MPEQEPAVHYRGTDGSWHKVVDTGNKIHTVNTGRTHEGFQGIQYGERYNPTTGNLEFDPNRSRYGGGGRKSKRSRRHSKKQKRVRHTRRKQTRRHRHSRRR